MLLLLPIILFPYALQSYEPIMLLKLTYYSQIMLKIFFVHKTKYIIFYCIAKYIIGCTTKHPALCVHMHALNGGPRIIMMFSCGEGLGQAYHSHWSKDFSSIIPLCFSMPIIPKIMLA